jgi:Rrf2 family protein
MDILRRNTDYALRAMVNLARHYGNGTVSTRTLTAKENIPYQLACKLMQKLHSARLVESCMGPKGGFRLGKEPSKISLLEIIELIQGPIGLNRCLLGKNVCVRQKSFIRLNNRCLLVKNVCVRQKSCPCPVRAKLAELQQCVNSHLAAITLNELLQSKSSQKKGEQKN